jgi:hypothetical protein
MMFEISVLLICLFDFDWKSCIYRVSRAAVVRLITGCLLMNESGGYDPQRYTYTTNNR